MRKKKLDLKREENLLLLAATTSPEVFEYMLKNGYKMENPAPYFTRALDYGGGRIAEYFVKHHNQNYNQEETLEYIDWYMENHKTDFIKFHLENGGDINEPVSIFGRKQSLLTLALMYKNKRTCRILAD